MEDSKLFPYYIVRFKQFVPNKKIFPQKKFPYYIVRFKQWETLCGRIDELEFPYYIVRFKQHMDERPKNRAH